MVVVIRTDNWEEMLKALGTRNVCFCGATDKGLMYAPAKNNPNIVAEYITK